MYLGALEKQESAKPQVTSQKQIKVKINEMKVKINMKKNNETKSWFFENLNKIGKLRFV